MVKEPRGQDLDKKYRMLKASWMLAGVGQRKWQRAGSEGTVRTHLQAQWHEECGHNMRANKGRNVFSTSQVHTE